MSNASRATFTTGASPRYWPCGQCQAAPGQLCHTVTGNPAPSHVDRYRSVALWERYGQKAGL